MSNAATILLVDTVTIAWKATTGTTRSTCRIGEPANVSDFLIFQFHFSLVSTRFLLRQQDDYFLINKRRCECYVEEDWTINVLLIDNKMKPPFGVF